MVLGLAETNLRLVVAGAATAMVVDKEVDAPVAEAVTTALPPAQPLELKLVDALPSELVVTLLDDRVPQLVEKLTITLPAVDKTPLA